MFEYDTWLADKKNIIYFTSIVTDKNSFGHNIVLAFDASGKGSVYITAYIVYNNMDNFNKCPEPNLTLSDKEEIIKAVLKK